MRRKGIVETREDRLAMAEEAGVGRVSLTGVLAGTLVAYGAFAVLLALAAGTALTVGANTDLSTNDWRELGMAGGVIAAVLMLVSYYFGGYVAGRMARRAGLLNGLLVFVTGVVIAGAIGIAMGAQEAGDSIADSLRGVGVPTSTSEWQAIGTVAGLGSLLAMLLGSLAGGTIGERWHGKLATRALDPEIGPAARARHDADAAAGRLAEAQDRRDTAVDDMRGARQRSEEIDLRDGEVETAGTSDRDAEMESETDRGGRGRRHRVSGR